VIQVNLGADGLTRRARVSDIAARFERLFDVALVQ